MDKIQAKKLSRELIDAIIPVLDKWNISGSVAGMENGYDLYTAIKKEVAKMVALPKN